MTKKYLLILFFSPYNLSALDKQAEQSFDKLGQIKDTVEVINAGLIVIKAAAYVGQAIKEKVCQDEQEQYKTEVINNRMRILQTQEELAQCLIAHAQEKRDSNQLPSSCKSFADSYAAVAGFEQLSAITSEFIEAVDEFDFTQINAIDQQNGMSAQKKVLIGVVVVGGVGVLAVVAAPMVFPGTVVASKATAISASAKSLCATVGAKVTMLKNSAIILTQNALSSTTPITQIQLAGSVIMKAEMAQRYLESIEESICQLPEEELIKLKVSLAERMKAAYAQKCKR